MSLAAGTRLGPYEITTPLGAGGMGEVYRATDTRLKRVVAIKVLPAHAASDQTRRERFDREARAVSSLNHPQICALYDVGHQDGVDFLVMECCDGETLAERLAKRPLPLGQVLRVAIDVAEALAAAHRAGLIHRDLKPSNVMLTAAGAKLLDFGVAKWRTPEQAFYESATLIGTNGLTVEGSLVGTLNYMAPEQLEGKEADSRADIFAFGAVLYEMASGQAAFAGTSRASVIAAILEREPAPLLSVQPLTPPTLARVVQKCLAKNPEERWQTAHDLADELRWIAEADPKMGAAASRASKRIRRSRVTWLAAGMLVLVTSVAILTVANSASRTTPTERLMRFVLPPPADASFSDQAASMAMSPDGRHIAFLARRADGIQQLWVRSLDSLDAHALPGTEGAFGPFWSADSRYLGFGADRKLKKIELAGGRPQSLCEAPDLNAGTWNRDDVILFTSADGRGIHRVSASGGPAVPVTTLDKSRGELSHMWVEFLPDGRHFLYRIFSSQQDRKGIYVASLESTTPRRLNGVNSSAMYAPPGYLVFAQDGRLMAQRLDMGELRLVDDPILLGEHVLYNRFNGRAIFAVSQNGVLAYRSASMTKLAWFDRNGRELRALGPPDHYADPLLSPDETRVTVARPDPRTAMPAIWFINSERGSGSQLTLDAASDVMPLWSADGREIIYSSNHEGFFDLYRRGSGSMSREEVLFKSDSNKWPLDWSRDGRHVMYFQSISNDARTPSGLWALPLIGDRVARRLGPYEYGQFSPDGRWIAYHAGPPEHTEVYIESFLGVGPSVKISSHGGEEPKWRRDGKELFYIASGQEMMAVPLSTQPTLAVGIPRPLFRTNLGYYRPNVTSRNRYDVTADGQRFLMNVSLDGSSSPPITVVVNWTTTLNRH